MSSKLKAKYKQDLEKSLVHLDYSFRKVTNMSFEVSQADEETLETLESFAARFARASDIFISNYLKILVLEQDPGFRGTLIDLLNFAEKANLILSAKEWFRIRELRNIAAHEYTSDDLQALYSELIRLTPKVLAVTACLS